MRGDVLGWIVIAIIVSTAFTLLYSALLKNGADLGAFKDETDEAGQRCDEE